MNFLHRTKKYMALTAWKMWAFFPHSYSYFTYLWDTHQVKIDKLIQAMIVATTTVSTYLSTIGMVPIFSSVLPVAAGMPLIGIVSPHFSWMSLTITLLTLNISLIMGYLKYQELQSRAHLDATILQNQNNIRALEETVHRLESYPQDYRLRIRTSKPEPRITPRYHSYQLTSRLSNPVSSLSSPPNFYTSQKYFKIPYK